MKLLDKLHMLHRFWHYRLRTERESIQFLLGQKISGTIAIDVGANRGVYTYWLSRQVGKAGKVFAFEPQPELTLPLEELKKSFCLNNVSIINKGLSSTHNFLQLHRENVGSGGASFHFEKERIMSITVETIRLDDYFVENPTPSLPVSFIKIDVEGHELEVFKGAEDTILKHAPTLLFECHHAAANKGELFSFLVERGYTGWFFHDKRKIDYTEFGRFPYRKPGESHRNYIFMHKNQ